MQELHLQIARQLPFLEEIKRFDHIPWRINHGRKRAIGIDGEVVGITQRAEFHVVGDDDADVYEWEALNRQEGGEEEVWVVLAPAVDRRLLTDTLLGVQARFQGPESSQGMQETLVCNSRPRHVPAVVALLTAYV